MYNHKNKWHVLLVNTSQGNISKTSPAVSVLRIESEALETVSHRK